MAGHRPAPGLTGTQRDCGGRQVAVLSRAGASGAELPPLPDVLRGAPGGPKGGLPETALSPGSKLNEFAKTGAWADALAVLQQLKDQEEAQIRDYNAAISACSRARQSRYASALYKEMISQQMPPDVYTYGALLASASATAASELMTEMARRGVKRNKVVTSLAMKALVKGSHWQRVLRLFEEAPEADARLFTVALGACRAGSCWEQALQLMRDMPGSQVTPDLIAWNAAMTACAKARKWEQALWIFDQGMKPVRPDLFSFNTALHSLDSDRWQMALEIFGALTSLQPDTVTLNTLLQMVPEPTSALRLFREMQEASVQCNDRSYSALMATQPWEEALMLFDEGKAKGIALTTHLYGTALQACSVGRHWQLAVALEQEMRGASLRLNNKVCAAAINSCVVPFDSGQGELWTRALTLFRDLTEAGERPDGVTYIALLSAFASCSRWEKALQLHKQTQSCDSLEERLKCTNAAITACGRGIAWPMAMQLFETQRPSLVTHNALLSALAEGSQWQLALQVFKSLLQKKMTPTVVTLNSMLHALCRGSHHLAAQRLLGRMPSYSLTADLYSYTTVMSACTSVSCWETTCELLCNMISAEIDPDIYSINNMIGALANTPKWKEALHMFSNMENFRLAPDFVTHSVILAGRIQAMVQEEQLDTAASSRV